MKLHNIVACLTVTLSTFGAIIPSAFASETHRELDHHEKKSSKKNKSDVSKGHHHDNKENDEIYYPSFSMSMDFSSMSLDMAYPSGKGKGGGKGKSGKKGGHESGKGTKSSKKGTKSDKKGSGKGKGGDDDTHGNDGSLPAHPAPTPSSADQPNRPPSPIPPVAPPSASPPSATPPSDSPPPTALPSAGGANLQEVRLPRYGITYTLEESLMPMREDYLEVEALTNKYFSDYMLEVFEEPSEDSLIEFRTTLVTSEFGFDEPVLITYDSVAYFAEDFPAASLPSPETLEDLLLLAFEDPTDYLDLLASLGEENAFSSTESVAFAAPAANNSTSSEPIMRSESPGSSDTGSSAAVIAAGAVGATLLVAGILLYRRRQAANDDDFFTKKDKPRGGATVAGETYAGETFDGTISVSPSSQLLSDEEQGMVNVEIDETETVVDMSSVSPAWEGLNSTTPNAYESDDESDFEGSEDEDEKEEKLLPNKQDIHEGNLGSESDVVENTTVSILSEENNNSSVPLDQKVDTLPKSVEAFDAYLGPTIGSMSIDSQEIDEENESIQSERRSLSVAEIESMLNTSF